MISSAYSYYLTQYGSQAMHKYDTSVAKRPSDIKRAYGRLQSLNRTTPTYKTDTSLSAQRYAIDLKENARTLSNIANELSSDNSDELIIRQNAESDNPDIVSAKYIGTDSENVPGFSIEVSQLASTQINTGNFLPPNSKLLTPGEYSFDLNMADITYEFEFSISEHDTSKTVQDRLARLINRSNIGLKASVISDDMGNTAINIESKDTGIKGMNPMIFDINENPTAASSSTSAIDTLGLNRVSQYPSNALYSIDGENKTSYSNDIRVNNNFNVTLHGTTNDSPVNISLKTDGDSVVKSISELISGYNNLLTVTNSTGSTFDGTGRLQRQFANITRIHHEILSQSGFDINDNGTIEVNSNKIKDLVNSDNVKTVFEGLAKFKNSIQNTAEKISMNPMDYVNNKIIAYKNPAKATTDPYNTSAYTGMMFNDYI